MKQYDKIWVPIPHSEAVKDCESRAIGVNYFKPEKDVIVLTLEELREVWEACYDQREWMHSKYRKTTDTPCPPDFREFLTSKGIKL